MRWEGRTQTLSENLLARIKVFIEENPAIIGLSGGSHKHGDQQSCALLESLCALSVISPIDEHTISRQLWEFRQSITVDRRVFLRMNVTVQEAVDVLLLTVRVGTGDQSRQDPYRLDETTFANMKRRLIRRQYPTCTACIWIVLSP